MVFGDVRSNATSMSFSSSAFSLFCCSKDWVVKLVVSMSVFWMQDAREQPQGMFRQEGSCVQRNQQSTAYSPCDTLRIHGEGASSFCFCMAASWSVHRCRSLATSSTCTHRTTMMKRVLIPCSSCRLVRPHDKRSPRDGNVQMQLRNFAFCGYLDAKELVVACMPPLM